MRPFNVTDDDDDETTTDDDDDAVYPVTIIPISKELTFNEKLTMWVVCFAIAAWCLKERYCKEYFCCRCCWWWTRIVRTPDQVESEFRHKVRQRRYDFDVNLGNEAPDHNLDETQDGDEEEEYMVLNNQKEEMVLVHETMASKRASKVNQFNESAIVVDWAEPSERSERNMEAERTALQSKTLDPLNES